MTPLPDSADFPQLPDDSIHPPLSANPSPSEGLIKATSSELKVYLKLSFLLY